MYKRKPLKNISAIYLAPSLIGFSLFYLGPFIMAFYHTIMRQGAGLEFAGLDNYIQLFNNEIFRRGFRNSVVFIGLSVPISMTVSLAIAMGIDKLKKQKRLLQCIVLIPIVIPTASIAFFWKQFFSMQGSMNRIMGLIGLSTIDWLNSPFALSVIVCVFIWKNIGYNTILFTAGLHNIPTTYYESASLDGANGIDQFRYITWIYLLPTTSLVFIMSIINSFKVFKEVYLIAGGYPHESIYMLQHYMNNMFMSLNYQKLSTSAYILVIFIIMLLAILIRGYRRNKDER